MDHIAIPAVVRTPTGAKSIVFEVDVPDGWVMVEPVEVGGPALTVDAYTWERLVWVSARLGD